MDADKILIIEAGRIIERGNFESLMPQNTKFAQMLRLQQQKKLNAILLVII